MRVVVGSITFLLALGVIAAAYAEEQEVPFCADPEQGLAEAKERNCCVIVALLQRG